MVPYLIASKFFLLFFFFLFFFFLKVCFFAEKSYTRYLHGSTQHYTLKMTSLKEWIDLKIKDGDIVYFEYSEFSEVEKIGQGGFGIIERAHWKSGGITVALKILTKNPSINEDNMNRLFKEVGIGTLDPT